MLKIECVQACELLENAVSFPADPSMGVMVSMRQHRASLRMPLELPVEVRWKSRTGSNRQASGKTGNMSGNGLFIEIPVRPQRDTPVIIRVQLPREVTGVPLEIVCQGRVVRWNRRGQSQGLGAVIDEYELRRVPGNGPVRKLSPRVS